MTTTSLKARAKKFLEVVFRLKERQTTIKTEFFTGYVQFISCLYVLAVIPHQMSAAGIKKRLATEIVALACAVGCCIGGLVTNLPFIIAPPTAVSIYLVVAIQQDDLSYNEFSSAVVLSGLALLMIGIFKSLSVIPDHVRNVRLIPECIQAGTSVGIGLITALAGCLELQLVQPGKYTILTRGPVTSDVGIAMATTIIIALAMHYHIKGSFMYGLLFGTLFDWWLDSDWPTTVGAYPQFHIDSLELLYTWKVMNLFVSLTFLYIVTGNGISRSLSDQAALTEKGNVIPCHNWIYIVCGLTTILSGCCGGPPILVSPESASGIKAGARSGLSTVVCGLLFAVSLLFCPVFEEVPPSGTTPLLILVGMLLFTNAMRIQWAVPLQAVSAFFVIMLIPFQYSIISGVGFGWFLYIVISIFSGEGDFNCFTCCKRKAIQPYPSSSSIPSTPSTPHLEHMMTAHQTVNGHLFVPVPSKSTALQHLEQDDEEDYEDDEEVGSPLVSAISVNPLLKIASGSAGNSGGGVVGKGRAPTPTVVDGGNSPSQWVGNWLASPTNLSIEAFLKNSPLPSDMYPYSPTTVKDN